MNAPAHLRSGAGMCAKPKVAVTHPDKVYFPNGFTKGEMIRYYAAIAPVMLPHLRNRPVTLIRFPNGVKGESFYEKNAPAHRPDWVKTFPVPRRAHEGEIDYILVNDLETLAWCANLGAIELHPFLHRVPKLDQPTHVAFDLDPGEGANLLTCIEVALLLREMFAKLELQAFPKVSGSKGLQLYVPLHTPTTYEATSPFAKTVAELLARQNPKLVVSEMSKALRKNRVMIDWSQNSASKTTVCVYSLRAKRDEPFVSTPVTWAELERALKKKDRTSLDFTPADVLARIKKHGDLFADVLTLKQKLPKAFQKLSSTPVGRQIAAEAAEAGVPGGRRKKGASRRQTAGATSEASATGSLKRYAEKRDFTKTAEPAPRRVSGKTKGKAKKGSLAPAAATGAGAGGERRFVIQKHAASHLHFDFRLEMGGTLKSWAVPKGLPYELGVKRSAFQVEDHPIDYLDFEGTIPKGQYGGGTVMVWDIGTYEQLGGHWHEGDLKLRLNGRKLKGEWHIFRIKSDDDKPVWLVAKSGEPLKPLSMKRENTSVLTGRSMEKIAAENTATWVSNA